MKLIPEVLFNKQRQYDMNGRSQMQGGKNWILTKEIKANRFFSASHGLEILKKPLWDLMEGAWLWTKTTRKAYLAVCLSEGQLGTRHVYQPAILQSAPPRYRRLSVTFSDTRVRTSASLDSLTK